MLTIDPVSSIAVVALATAIGAAGALKLLLPTEGATLATEIASRGRPFALAVAMLPYIEIALAAALVAPGSRQIAVVICLGLVGSFSLVISTSTFRKRSLPCGCFGSSGATTATATLFRNAGLIALAIVVLLAADPEVETAVLALAALAATGLVVSSVLARALHKAVSQQFPLRSEEAPDGLDEVLATTDGATTTVRTWLATGRAHVLVFVDPLCAPCRAVLPAAARRQLESGRIGVAVVSRGPLSENDELAREFGLAPIAVQSGDALARRFGISGTPAALLVSESGEVASGPALGRAAVLALLDGAFLARAS